MDSVFGKLDSSIRQAQKGEESAREYLCEGFMEFAFGIAYIHLHNFHDAEDIAQEASIKAINAIERFKIGTNLRAWLSRITINCIADTLRKRYGTHWPLKHYRQWIIDFIYSNELELRDLVAGAAPQNEHLELYGRLGNDLKTMTFQQLCRLKYESAVHNDVLDKVRKWIYEYIGFQELPFSALANENGRSIVGSIAHEGPNPEAAALEREFVSRVNAYIDRLLSEKRRSYIHLHYMDGLGPKEIAEKLGVSPNSVSQALNDARKALAKMMAEDDFFTDYQHYFRKIGNR